MTLTLRLNPDLCAGRFPHCGIVRDYSYSRATGRRASSLVVPRDWHRTSPGFSHDGEDNNCAGTRGERHQIRYCSRPLFHCMPFLVLSKHIYLASRCSAGPQELNTFRLG